jgi:mutator protein MutT
MTRDRAVAILLHHGQLLVMYRETDGRAYYVFPGGGVERGESAEQAVVREIDEEASISLIVDRLLYELRHVNGDTHYFFACQYVSGVPQLRSGTNEYQDNLRGDLHEPRWLRLGELPEAVLYPAEIKDQLIHDLAAGFGERAISLTAEEW